MNRRSFLKAVLGLAASALLPPVAERFLEDNVALADAAFREKAIIDLIEARMRDAAIAVANAISAELYNDASTLGAVFLVDDDTQPS